jgi:hypothetical protein
MPRLLLASIAGLLVVAMAHATDVELCNLKSKAPDRWKSTPPSNKFRAYNFTLPGTGGKEDAELIVFFFGPGGGGGVNENISRWKGMFDSKDEPKVDKIKVGKAELTYVDVAGTYLSKFPPFDPNAKTTRKADYRLIGVVFECDGGPYFIRLTGPAATVQQHKDEFDRWLKNFK